MRVATQTHHALLRRAGHGSATLTTSAVPLRNGRTRGKSRADRGLHRQECPSTLLRASLCYLQAAAGRRGKQEGGPFGVAPERPLHGGGGGAEGGAGAQKGDEILCPYKEKEEPGVPVKV